MHFKDSYQVYLQWLHLKLLPIFLLKIPSPIIDIVLSVHDIFEISVEPQVGHLGIFFSDCGCCDESIETGISILFS